MTFEVSGDVYDRHVGRYGPELARALIAFADVEPGDVVLDVGCGPGALTAELAAVAGAENVTAVDPSASFVAACAARVSGARVLRGTAEELPADLRGFTHVLSQLVVNFLSDAPAGVAAMARAARPGGVVAAAVWDYAGEMTMLRAFWDAALEVDPDAPDEGRTMSYSSEPELAELWNAAGLADVRTTALVVEARYADFDDYWSPFPTGLAPSGAYCASLAPEAREALRERVRSRLGSPDGAFTLGARAWAVRGTRGA